MEVGTPATSRSSTVGSATPRRRVAVPSRRLGGAGREAPAFPAGGGGGAIVGTREWPRLECNNNEFGVGDRVGPARRSPSRWPVNRILAGPNKTYYTPKCSFWFYQKGRKKVCNIKIKTKEKVLLGWGIFFFCRQYPRLQDHESLRNNGMDCWLQPCSIVIRSC